MNQIENNLKQALHNAVQKAFDTELDTASIVIEIPKDKSHGDYSTNVAMQLTRVLKNNPRKIAEAVVEALDKAAADIESCEIAGPGFINFTIKNKMCIRDRRIAVILCPLLLLQKLTEDVITPVDGFVA